MPALLKARCEMEGVKKRSDNPFFSSKYANYESIIDEAMGPLWVEELVLTIAPGLLADGVLDVHARITHAPTGQYIGTTMGMPLGKQATPQSAGSAITYASRYLVQALLALPSADDDGSAANKQAQAPHPDLAEWKRTLDKCKDEEAMKAWIDLRYDAISKSGHKDEMNSLYQARLDRLRNT